MVSGAHSCVCFHPPTHPSFTPQGALDDRSIEVEVAQKAPGDKGGVIQVDSPVSVQEVLGKFQKMANKRPSEMKKMRIREARPVIEEQELEKLMEVRVILCVAGARLGLAWPGQWHPKTSTNPTRAP